MKNENIHLNKKDVSKAAWRWLFFHQSAHSYERMMGVGFAHSLSGSLEKLYKGNDKGLKNALKRNLTFFNTEPQIGSIIPGISLALEETYANDPNFDPEVINSTKNALMGPLAGIGDSIVCGTLNPILLSIGIGLSTGGSPVGAIFFLFLWLAIVVPMKYFFFVRGYSLGLAAIKILTNELIKTKITTALTMIGLIVIGGVASATLKANVIWKYTSGKMAIDAQQLLNQIMPALIPLIIALVSYYLVSKRNWSSNKLLLGILVFAAVMVALGIM